MCKKLTTHDPRGALITGILSNWLAEVIVTPIKTEIRFQTNRAVLGKCNRPMTCPAGLVPSTAGSTDQYKVHTAKSSARSKPTTKHSRIMTDNHSSHLKDWLHFQRHHVFCESNFVCYMKRYPQSSSTLWNYSKCGVYTVESEAGC
jgi:hypothetical protein